ncbi:MAG TPA: SLATT domain-containing protein [Myxococcaceae bacterium]|nr:SLATT domain-containing protein [Myxococcaceae bacterium]
MPNELIVPGPGARSSPAAAPAAKVVPKDHHRNLNTAELPAIFIDGVHDDEMRALYHAALDKSHEAVRWYMQGVRAKRGNAKVVRIGTVILGAVAAIIPIVSSRVQGLWGLDIIPFATVSAALAGGLVAADKYFGFSTGYIRYTNARQEIQAKIERFQMSWCRAAIQQSAANPPTPKAEALNTGLTLIQELVDGIAQTVAAETQQWMAEFKQNLTDIEKSVADAKEATAPAAHVPAALKVTVDGWDQLSQPRVVKIRINDRAEEEIASPTYVLGGLAPGQYVIRISASAGGKPVAGSEILSLKAGEVGTAQVKLG